MTLTTHAVVGAAIAEILPTHPLLGFLGAFASHFLIDAVPHGHYRLRAKKYNFQDRFAEDIVIDKGIIADLTSDLFKGGSDFFLGLGLAFLLFQPLKIPVNSIILTGALGGMLPDFFQIIYLRLKREPLLSFQKFHMWMHAEKRFDDDLSKKAAIEFLTILAAFFFVIGWYSG